MVGETEGVADSEGVMVVDVEGVLEVVPLVVGDGLGLPDRDGVLVGLGVPDTEAPAEGVPELEGVGEGEANTTPCTYMGDVYTVPALVTEFHWLAVKLPAATPAHTLLTPIRP